MENLARKHPLGGSFQFVVIISRVDAFIKSCGWDRGNSFAEALDLTKQSSVSANVLSVLNRPDAVQGLAIDSIRSSHYSSWAGDGGRLWMRPVLCSMRLRRKSIDGRQPNIIVTPTMMDFLAPCRPNPELGKGEIQAGFCEKFSTQPAWAPWSKLI